MAEQVLQEVRFSFNNATFQPHTYFQLTFPIWCDPQRVSGGENQRSSSRGSEISSAGLPKSLNSTFVYLDLLPLSLGLANESVPVQCGVRVTSLSGNELADALIKATQNPLIKEAAAKVGERIRSEHGVETAIDCIYSYLHRARESFFFSERKSSLPAHSFWSHSIGDRHVSYKPPRATSPRPLSFPLLRSPLQPSLAKRSSSPTTINRQDT